MLGSANDDDVDGASEGGGVEVLVVLIGRADGADRTAQIVHRGRRRGEGRGRWGRCNKPLDGDNSRPLPQPK